jgi:hypothetical protein
MCAPFFATINRRNAKFSVFYFIDLHFQGVCCFLNVFKLLANQVASRQKGVSQFNFFLCKVQTIKHLFLILTIFPVLLKIPCCCVFVLSIVFFRFIPLKSGIYCTDRKISQFSKIEAKLKNYEEQVVNKNCKMNIS